MPDMDDKSIEIGRLVRSSAHALGGRAGRRENPDADHKYSENWRVWRTGEWELLKDSEVEYDASGPRLRNIRASTASQARNQERLADGLGETLLGIILPIDKADRPRGAIRNRFGA